jgi:predicted aldo/keto reductase-like oxidoreductase
MKYKEYGKTGVTVSALGMGGMRFEKPQEIDEMAQVLLRAFERGITYFDTAPFYCDDKSEEIYGTAIKEMKKTGRPFRVATKTMAAEPAEIRAACERSLGLLNVDAIDFYHVWCLVHPEDLGKRKAQGALDEFRKLKEEGLVRHVCVSTHLEHDRIAGMIDEGEGLFEGMLIGLNAMNFDLRYPGVKEAGRRGMGVVTMNTLGGGLLMSHADHYGFLMRDGDHSMLDAAIRFNMSLPEVSVALVGFRNVTDVDSAIDAAERFEALTAGEIETLRHQIAAAGKDFCTQCGYCRDCPAEIPVVRFMDAYNHRMLDGPEAGVNHLKWHWWTPDIRKALESCTECRHCEDVCTQHLPVLERFEQLRKDQDAVSSK